MALCKKCEGSGLDKKVGLEEALRCKSCSGSGSDGKKEPKPVEDKKVVEPIAPELLEEVKEPKVKKAKRAKKGKK